MCVFIAAVIFSDFADKYNNFGLYWGTVEMMVQVPAFLSFSFFIISLILLFAREEVFHSWKKFTIVYLPIAAIFLFLAAGESGGGIGLASIDSEIISWFLSGLFLFISILIIGVKSWKSST